MFRRIAVTTLLLCGLTGCATTPGTADGDPPSGSNTAEGKPEKVEDRPLKFGSAFTWKDGLTVKVSEPKPFKPSKYAAVPGRGNKHVVFTVTVVNKTPKTFDPSLFNMTMQSANVEAQQLFDKDKELNGTPATKLLQGRESQFRAGFTVKNPQDLVLDLSPDAGLEHEPALWQR
jgi:hypothetical protein